MAARIARSGPAAPRERAVRRARRPARGKAATAPRLKPLFAPSVPAAEHYLAQARQHLDFPDYPNGGATIGPLNALARAKGFRVLLTGLGGNLWLESRAEHLADLLRRGRLRAWIAGVQ